MLSGFHKYRYTMGIVAAVLVTLYLDAIRIYFTLSLIVHHNTKMCELAMTEEKICMRSGLSVGLLA